MVDSPGFQRTPFTEINEFRPVWNFPDNDCASGIDRKITVHRVTVDNIPVANFSRVIRNITSRRTNETAISPPS